MNSYNVIQNTYALEFTSRIIEMIEKLSSFSNMGRKVSEVD